MKKIVLSLTLLLIFSLAACTTDNEPTPPVGTEPVVLEPVEADLPIMTLEELSLYDGKSGAKAYVAISGYVYDVTESVYWPNGNHNGYQAGQDLTVPLTTLSPHGVANIQRFPIVAKLADGE